MALSPGTRLGPYEILAPIGAGGMGEVYRAKDPRLGREVAIKVLPSSLSTDPDRLRRFEQEARATGVLNHPNIVAVYDVGSQEGSPYVVEELLEGETLRERLVRGLLPMTETVTLAVELAHGLAAAHVKGIVHRDIKPENLFLTRQGRLKILDFGLARVSTEEPVGSQAPTEAGTEPGLVLGTVAYMSPEQVRGQSLDARSDIFSVGIVLYEMLSGKRPFAGGSSAEVMSATLREDPAPLLSVSPPLDRIVRRCLEKNPERRFQHAGDVAFTLQSLSEPTAPGVPREGPPSVAVLLFRDLAGDPANAHVGLGLADATITELASMKSLRVRPTASSMRFRERTVEPEAAGRELGVDAVLDGNFQRSGSRLRVTVQLVRTLDGKSLWGAKIDTSLEDLFQMQDQVSRRIADALEVELTPADERRLARASHKGSKAYELYLKGMLHLSADTTLIKINEAIEFFQEAIEKDPALALARLGLADAYTRLAFSFDPEGDWYNKAEEVCRETLASDPELPEGRYLRGRLLWHPRRGFDHAGALREFSAAVVGRPNLAEAHRWLALVLVHVGLFEEALGAFTNALEIDPQDGYSRTHRGLALYLQGLYREALASTEAELALLSSPWNIYQQVLCLLHLERGREAAVALEKGSRQFPDFVLFAPLRGRLAATSGDAARAREQIELVVRNRKGFGHYHHAQYDVACLETLLGRRQEAIRWLSEAAREGFPCTPVFETDPWLEPLRQEKAFQDLLAELRVERESYSKLYRQQTTNAS